jgi:TolA-binding protein
MLSTRVRGPAAFLLAVLAAGPVRTAAAQPTPDQQAEAVLNAGRKAYNEGNPQFAADRFTELLNKFGGSKYATDARYGLGLATLDLPDRNYQKAIDAFGPPAADAAFPDRARARYYLGVCQRGIGHKELAEGVARPNEMPQRQQTANGKFGEALNHFVAAREAFEKKTPPDADWAARARCDTAEMELRLGKVKESRATVEPFVKDPALAKNKFRPLGLYYFGTASFLLGDVPAAGKALGQLAPFDQPYGPHARYLRGRVHAAQGENAEAAVAFDAVVAEYAKQKAEAVEALKRPDRFKTNPFEKARLEALVRNPAADYVAGAAFYAASLNYETGRFADALGKFEAFTKDYATSPLKDDAALRLGFSQVQTKQFDVAVRTLQPLTNHPRLADQALFWTAKAQAGLAAAIDPNNPNGRKDAFNAAINTFRSASDRANQLTGQDPDAKTRRAEIFLELADTQLAAKLPRDAAGTYETIWNEKLLPAKAEETLQRLITAYHLAGDLPTSEARIATFRQQFPNSTLMPLVAFRAAENAYARGEGFAKQNRPADAKVAFADAGARYAEVAAKYPEFERVNRARYGQALCLIAAEDWEKAIKVLKSIPAAERAGDLAPAPYVLADALIRTAPAKAEDALQDGVLRDKLGAASALLDAFVAANPRADQTPDALLKLGSCEKRLAVQLQPGNERNEALNKARAAFERLPREFGQSPLVGHAHLERAKVLALQGDKGNAINALREFKNDPLQKSPVAPLGMIYLATLLREQKQPLQAADALQEARQKFEGGLNTPKKAEWLALLRYHHGVALLESNKPGDARTAFDQAAQAAPALPIAVEATLKGTQCQAEEVKAKIAALEQQKQPGMNPDQAAALANQIKAAKAELAHVAKLFEQRAETYRPDHPQSEARARMFYDAAWAYRAAGADPGGAYAKLLAQFPDLALAVEGRLELAEVLADAGKADDAIKLLKDAIDKEPADKPTPPETIDRVRIRLGAALFEKTDFAAAQGQFDAVGNNDKSPLRAHGLYRSAECALALDKADDAQKKLVVFRDNPTFHNVAGVSDRALLRLGYAYARLKQWEPARQAFQMVIDRYGNNNAWAVDARYGIGWALQNQGRYDDAVTAYALVTQATTDDRAAKAHLQIGLCRAAQSKWSDAGKSFASVYFGYELPDLKFPAMLEHARALVEEKKPEEATKLLDRVLKDAPKGSEWAKAAQERLDKVKKK